MLPAVALFAQVPTESAAEATDAVRVMSFNLRYLNSGDGDNRWQLRRHRVAGLLRLHRVDILGVQEAMGGHVDYLLSEFPNYDSFGIGRDGGSRGERSSIFWNKDKFDRLRGATFWLSETPDRPSNAWGAKLRRICTWCEFRSRLTKKSFFVFNTHFDHQSREARRRSAQLVRQKIQEVAGARPVVFMGDLNCDDFSAPYRELTQSAGLETGVSDALIDTRVWTEHDYGPKGTWSGWDPNFIGSRIDFIFVKNAVRVLQHAVIPHEWQGRVASDHLPVIAELLLHDSTERRYLSMVHLWRMMPDKAKRGIELGYHEPGYDDRKWPAISAGDGWERQSHPNLDGIVYLRKEVFVPESWRSCTVQFVTDGIADVYKLYVNGEMVHEAGDKRNSMWSRRTNLHLANSSLRFGQQNTFVFRVIDFGGLGGLVGHPILLTTDDRQPTATANTFATEMLMATREFAIPENSRRVEFELEIPDESHSQAWLRIGLGDGYDESGGVATAGNQVGDLGVDYELQAADGRVALRGFTSSKDVAWLIHRVEPGSKWKLIVIDADCSFAQGRLGNTCSLTAELLVDAGK